MTNKKFPIKKIRQNLEKLKRSLPIKLAAATQRNFLDNFAKESFGNEPWKQVNRRIAGTNEYKYPKNRGTGRRTRNMLVGTGRLRRSVAQSIREKSFERIHMVVDLPYAAAHNEGYSSTQSVSAHKRQNIIRAKVRGSFEGTARRTKTIEILGAVSDVKVYSRNLNIPRRQYIGQNRTLTAIQKNIIEKEFDKVWQA